MDQTVEEIMKTRGGYRAPKKDEMKDSKFFKTFNSKSSLLRANKSDAPKNFDWRTEKPGSISPVKDQGMCGSCWAFSLISAVESANFLKTDSMTLLPEQFVIDCTW